MIDRFRFSGRLIHPVGALALMAGFAFGFGDAAQAVPLTPGKSGVVTSQVIQVRDGCGQGMRYSERRGGCVEDFDGGPRGYYPPPPPDFDRRPPPPPMYDRRPPPPPEYSRGPDRGDSDVAAGALIGGAVGALIGSQVGR